MDISSRKCYYVAKYDISTGTKKFLETIKVCKTKEECINIIINKISSPENHDIRERLIFSDNYARDGINYEIKSFCEYYQ